MGQRRRAWRPPLSAVSGGMALTGVPFVLQMDKNFLAKLAVSKPDEQVHALMAFDWEGISLEAMARAFLGRAASLADRAEAGNAGDADRRLATRIQGLVHEAAKLGTTGYAQRAKDLLIESLPETGVSIAQARLHMVTATTPGK